MIDTLHWDDGTYVDLLPDVILTIQQKQHISKVKKPIVSKLTIKEIQELCFATGSTMIYARLEEVLVVCSSCLPDLPILVTGIQTMAIFVLLLMEKNILH